MCGIAGFVRSNSTSSPDVAQHVLDTMTDVIAHRGPDGRGTYLDEEVGLGHRRLSIIDLSTGAQPLWDAQEQAVIVFNGEIYNYRELRSELELKGHRFRTQSDTEVILAAYLEYGKACVEKLNGIFAFAIYHKGTQELFLARDHFGVKPLYYYLSGNTFVFASEAKSLLKHPEIQARINPQALSLYLTFEHVPAPYSIYEGIQKLEQGWRMTWTEGKLTQDKYYQYTFQPKLEFASEADLIAELDERLYKAVERQMVADVPLGTFLSGGLDSSLVSAYSSRISSQPINTFNIAFNEKSFDESPFADKVSKHLGTQHHTAWFSADELLTTLDAVIDKMDEPFADPSILPTFMLSRFAKQHVTVALSGDGSDELFAGYPTYYARKTAGWIPPVLGQFAYPLAKLLPTSDENISLDFKIKKTAQGLAYGGDLRHQIWLGGWPPKEKKEVFRFNHATDPAAQLIAQHMKACDATQGWERSLWLDMRFYLQDNMLTKVDRASMMNGLEVRVPFLDVELSQFAMRLPPGVKYKGKQSKYILKKLAEKYLPHDIIYRSKKGFGIPVAKWLKGELKPLVDQHLLAEGLYKEGLIQPRFRQYLKEHETGKQDHRKLIWPLLILQLWRSHHSI